MDMNSLQNLVMMMHQQNQTTWAQLQTYMQQSQNQFNQVLNTRSLKADVTRKKDLQTYEGKLNNI